MAPPIQARWLASAPDDLKSEVIAKCDRLTLQQDQSIYRAGDEAGGIYGVISGRIDLHLLHLREGRTLLHCGGPGGWIGDMAALSGEPRKFELIAGRDSEVLRLTRSTLMMLCEAHPILWRNLAEMVNTNMRMGFNTIEMLRTEDPTARVATCLVRLSAGGPGWGGTISVSQSELASLCDIARRRVGIALEKLESLGYIKRKYGHVEITDANGLGGALPKGH